MRNDVMRVLSGNARMVVKHYRSKETTDWIGKRGDMRGTMIAGVKLSVIMYS